MTTQHPAAPETETDASGRLAERLTWAVEKCCQCTDGHHDWPANPYGTEGDVRMSRDDARMIVALLADLDAARERVRVVEGEREHWKDHAEEAGRGFERVCLDYNRVAAARTAAIARAESAEAAHEAARELCHEQTTRAESANLAHEAEKAAHERLRAGVEALAASLDRGDSIDRGIAADLRSLLAGGGA